MVSQVKHSQYVRVGAQAAYCLGFSGDAGARDIVHAFGLDQGKGHVTVQEGVIGQVDFFLASFAQKTLDLVTTV